MTTGNVEIGGELSLVRLVDVGINSRTRIGSGSGGGTTINETNQIAIGEESGYHDQGQDAIAIGRQSGWSSQSSNTVAVGTFAGAVNQSSNAVAVGYQSGNLNQSLDAVAIGYQAGRSSQGDRTVAIGNEAGRITQGSRSVAVGYQAGQTGQMSFATAIGFFAGQSSQSDSAVAVGGQAGQISQGAYSVAVGKLAGASSQQGRATSVGYLAGNNTQGQDAVAIGNESGKDDQSNKAVAVGTYAGKTDQGASAVAVGYLAGETNQGDNSIILNATGVALNSTTASSFHVKPVRGGDFAASALAYTADGEIVEETNVHFDTAGNVGIGTDSPTSNLHVVGDALITGNVADLNVVSNVNMLHTSNTASIKLNSNVVVEFPRSKKLIKYPRVALTSAAQTASGYEGYIVTRSSQFQTYNAWEAFDENNPKGTGQEGAGAGWASTIPGTYSVSTGAETGSVEHHTGSVQGEWIQIQLPESIYLHDFVIESRSETSYNASGFDHGFPEKVVLYGSNNGSSWVNIKSFTTVDKATSEAHTENINEMTRTYKYFALVVNSTHVFQNTTQVGHVSIGQIRLFGTPEYDPEADGVDVVIKSVPNVPNTDWLEVYYDAKDLADGSTTVNDLKPVGTAINGTVAGNTSVTDGAFTFDGSGDYISGTLPSSADGDWVHSLSMWFKADSFNSGSDSNSLFYGGGTSVSANNMIFLRVSGGANPNIAYTDIGNTVQKSMSVLTNVWYHVTATYSGGGWANAKMYINGELTNDGTSTDTIPLTLTGSSTFYIGKAINSSNPSFDGSIANFRLFNRALTSDEIYQLYAYQKEDFGHGVLGMTLKNGRLGIGTSEPRAALDVRGDIVGPFHTFLTGDVTTSSSTSFTASNQVKALNSFTFDVPKEYNSYGTANLEVFGQVKWSGEVEVPWNTVLKLRLYYGNLTTQIIHSVENPEAGTNNRGCGMIAISNHSDNGSTLDSAIASSKFLIPNCPVGPGSQLKLEILIQQGNSTSTVYTNRTTGALDDPNYERGTTNFFMALKVV